MAKAYKNLDELLAQLRASFYTGPTAEPAAAEPRAAKDALAEADKLSATRGAGGQAAAPQPTPPEPEYEEYDDGLGARGLTQLCCCCCCCKGLIRCCCLQTAALQHASFWSVGFPCATSAVLSKASYLMCKHLWLEQYPSCYSLLARLRAIRLVLPLVTVSNMSSRCMQCCARASLHTRQSAAATWCRPACARPARPTCRAWAGPWAAAACPASAAAACMWARTTRCSPGGSAAGAGAWAAAAAGCRPARVGTL